MYERLRRNVLHVIPEEFPVKVVENKPVLEQLY
jgi:hypothetical protein